MRGRRHRGQQHHRLRCAPSCPARGSHRCLPNPNPHADARHITGLDDTDCFNPAWASSGEFRRDVRRRRSGDATQRFPRSVGLHPRSTGRSRLCSLDVDRHPRRNLEERPSRQRGRAPGGPAAARRCHLLRRVWWSLRGRRERAARWPSRPTSPGADSSRRHPSPPRRSMVRARPSWVTLSFIGFVPGWQTPGHRARRQEGTLGGAAAADPAALRPGGPRRGGGGGQRRPCSSVIHPSRIRLGSGGGVLTESLSPPRSCTAGGRSELRRHPGLGEGDPSDRHRSLPTRRQRGRLGPHRLMA